MTARVEAARAAALAVARAHGLAVEDAELLHDGVNVVLHLRMPEHLGEARERLAASVEEVSAGLVGRRRGPG
jgi:hypothetical protein